MQSFSTLAYGVQSIKCKLATKLLHNLSEPKKCFLLEARAKKIAR